MISLTEKIYYFVFLILLIYFYFYYDKCSNNILDLFDTTPKQYQSVIPLNLFTTWHTKKLPPIMEKNYESLKNINPEFNHFLYDDNDCREFIKKNYDEDVLSAFDTLIPGAYKADLWRYCVLFLEGGIYIDIKFNCTNGFKLIALTEKEYFVRDRYNLGIYNALMVCKAGNPILLKLIKQIVVNTQTQFYGVNALHPTGPYLMKDFIDQDTIDKLELFNSTSRKKMSKNSITLKDTIIIKSYDEYRTEQKKFQLGLHYHILWDQKKIYNTNTNE